MRQGRVRDFLTAQHARDLFHPLLGVERRDGGVGAAIGHALDDAQMLVAEFRDLGQMGDAQNLVALGQATSFLPTSSAVPPPMPASTSSKTTVSRSSPRARMALRASTTRESSPPDAIAARGLMASPTLGAIRKPARSAPLSVSACPSQTR